MTNRKNRHARFRIRFKSKSRQYSKPLLVITCEIEEDTLSIDGGVFAAFWWAANYIVLIANNRQYLLLPQRRGIMKLHLIRVIRVLQKVLTIIIAVILQMRRSSIMTLHQINIRRQFQVILLLFLGQYGGNTIKVCQVSYCGLTTIFKNNLKY